MPEAQENFQKAVAEVLETVMFESWLRFYFICEQPGEGDQELKIELPQKSIDRIRELYPRLYPLAEKMNGKTVDFEISRASVLNHLMEEVEGKILPKGETQKILQSSTFQTKLNLFHAWERIHEDQLDRGFAEFGAWRNLFASWLETPGAKELARQFSQ